MTGLDPAKTAVTTSDLDSVSLARELTIDLEKSSLYVEGTTGIDTIEYSFEASAVLGCIVPLSISSKIDKLLEHRRRSVHTCMTHFVEPIGCVAATTILY